MGFVDVAKVRAGNRAYMEKLEGAMEEAARTAGAIALARLRANPPFTSRSGKLLASTDFVIRSSKTGVLLKFESKAPHASFLEKGTRPHPITGSPIMKFYWEKLGSTVYFHKVMHPGTKATHFLEHTRDFASSLFITELHKRL